MLREFTNGILAYGSSFELITRLRLWRYLFVPIAISLVLAIGVIALVWGLGDDFGTWIAGWYPWESGKPWIEGAARIIGVIGVLAFGLIAYKQIIMALASPFMSPLSEKIERELRGESVPVKFSAKQFFSDLVRGIRIASRNLVRELGLTIFLFLLGLIPVFSPFTPILIFLVQSYYAGFGNMDYTMERHFGVRQTVRFVKAHRGLALGNGIVFMGLLFTGLGFIIALPLGSVAATKETVRILAAPEK